MILHKLYQRFKFNYIEAIRFSFSYPLLFSINNGKMIKPQQQQQQQQKRAQDTILNKLKRALARTHIIHHSRMFNKEMKSIWSVKNVSSASYIYLVMSSMKNTTIICWENGVAYVPFRRKSIREKNGRVIFWNANTSNNQRKKLLS